MSIILPESDPTTTERGRGRERERERGRKMCAVVYHQSTKMSLDWTLKTPPDM
jgi:hypothetical protein